MRITRGTTTNMKKMKVGIKLPDKWYRLDTDKKKKMATRKDENEANDIFTLDNRISVDCFFLSFKSQKDLGCDIIIQHKVEWRILYKKKFTRSSTYQTTISASFTLEGIPTSSLIVAL